MLTETPTVPVTETVAFLPHSLCAAWITAPIRFSRQPSVPPPLLCTNRAVVKLRRYAAGHQRREIRDDGA